MQTMGDLCDAMPLGDDERWEASGALQAGLGSGEPQGDWDLERSEQRPYEGSFVVSSSSVSVLTLCCE